METFVGRSAVQVRDLDRSQEFRVLYEGAECYELKLKGLSDRTTLVLSNTRELDRAPKTK